MSFRPNDISSRQLSFFDTSLLLSKRKKEVLDKSWAAPFRSDILPNIDEEPYRVLYDEEGSASRPNTPVNVLVAASVLMVRFGLSEDGFEAAVCLDIRFSYALGLDTISEDYFSMRTLRRFRKRCADYMKQTGIDLIRQTSESIADRMASIMGIDKTLRRMDSFMVDMTAKDMGRRELIYNANRKLVRYLFSIGDTEGIKHMIHYTEDGDRNKVLYHVEKEYRTWRDETLLKDALYLVTKCGERYPDAEEYKVLSRIVSEQTVNEDGVLRWRTREDGGFDSGMAQSTVDTDATFREKNGEYYKGYVANVEESVGENGSLITSYSFEKNNVSDKAMLESMIGGMGHQPEKTTIVTDGAYDNDSVREAAAEKNIEVVTTDLLGKDTDPVIGGFKFGGDGTSVISCPKGNAPDECKYNEKTGQCELKFKSGQCDGCCYRDICKASGKKYKKVKVSKSQAVRAKRQDEMGTEEFKKTYRFRNGVEAIPSYFRTVLNVDNMYAYGIIRNTIAFGFRVIAFNTMKFHMFRLKKLANCA
jgi:hypothetical protein